MSGIPETTITPVPTGPPAAPSHHSRCGALHREIIDEALWAARDSGRQLITIWALAGAGKTTVMHQWQLALHDADVEASWASVEDAERAAEAFQRGDGPTPTERWLFFDDADIALAGCGTSRLAAALPLLPLGTRVVIAARYQPAGFATVLNAASGVTALPGGLLALSTADTLRLAGNFGIALREEDAALLVARTDGWAAGIALAMPYLAASTDPAAAVALFDGDQRQVADFLIVKVLDGLDVGDRAVLMCTAVTGDVPLALAAELTGRPDIGAVLRRLSDRNMLVEMRPDTSSVRVHPILGSFLRADFRRRDIRAAVANHATAAAWFAERGDHLAALEQATHTADRSVIARQIEQSGVALLLQGHTVPLASALHQLTGYPPSLPVATIRLALDLPTFPDRVGAEEQLAIIRRLLATAPPDQRQRWRPFVESLGALLVRDAAAATTRLTELGAFLRTTPIDSFDSVLATRAAVAWCLMQAGRDRDAEPLLRSLQGAATRADYRWMYLMITELLVTMAARAGDWRAAMAAEQVLGRLPAEDFPPFTRITARMTLLQTVRAYERCAPVSMAPLRQIELADPTGAELGVAFATRALLLIATIDSTPDPRTPVLQLIQLVRADGARHPRMVAFVAPRLVRWTRLLHGPAPAAELRHILTAVLGAGSLEAKTLTLAVDPHASYATESAVVAALEHGRHAWVGQTEVHSNLLLAAHALGNGRTAQALVRTREALSLSEEYGFARELLAVQGAGARLIYEFRGSLGDSEPYAASVLQQAEASGVRLWSTAADGQVSLTPRELELLQELPAYQTVSEIAAKHHLSANTIKTHLRSIYAKLAVTGRAEAVSAARARGLL